MCVQCTCVLCAYRGWRSTLGVFHYFSPSFEALPLTEASAHSLARLVSPEALESHTSLCYPVPGLQKYNHTDSCEFWQFELRAARLHSSGHVTHWAVSEILLFIFLFTRSNTCGNKFLTGMDTVQVLTERHIPRNHSFSFLIIVYLQGIDRLCSSV